MKKSETKKFAEGINFKKLFFIFMVGCIFGVIWEESYLYIKRIILDASDPSWRLHRGVIYGPFNPVYGFGAAFMALALCRKKRPVWHTFIIATIIGGVIEYLSSFFQEILVGAVSWDYSDHFLNLHGRTNLLYAVFFGLLGLLVVYIVYPKVSDFIEKLTPTSGNVLFYSLFIFMIINCTITVFALHRQTERIDGLPPSNNIEKFCDEYYTDDFLNKYFVNLIRN